MEISLVRAALANPRLIDADEEAVIRTALSLARMYKVPHQGHDVGVGAWLEPFRLEIERRLKPLRLPLRGPVTRASLLPQLKDLKERTIEVRDGLAKRFEDRLS